MTTNNTSAFPFRVNITSLKTPLFKHIEAHHSTNIRRPYSTDYNNSSTPCTISVTTASISSVEISCAGNPREVSASAPSIPTKERGTYRHTPPTPVISTNRQTSCVKIPFRTLSSCLPNRRKRHMSSFGSSRSVGANLSIPSVAAPWHRLEYLERA